MARNKGFLVRFRIGREEKVFFVVVILWIVAVIAVLEVKEKICQNTVPHPANKENVR